MPESSSFLYSHYDQLVEEYGGLYILIRQNEVVFADKSAKIVFQFALKHFSDRQWEIAFIDSGDAAFYEIGIPNQKN